LTALAALRPIRPMNETVWRSMTRAVEIDYVAAI
jgi:hypothetical protein